VQLKVCQTEYLCMLHARAKCVLNVGRASQTLCKTQPPTNKYCKQPCVHRTHVELKACQAEYLCTLHAGGKGVLYSYVRRASQNFYAKVIRPQTKTVSNPTSIGPTWN
jgi:hypothetical protein